MILVNSWQPNPAFFLFLFIQLLVCNVGFTAGFTILENFETYGDGAFPSKWRSRSDEARKIYRIESEDGNRFLRAHADKQAVQIGLEHFLDPKQQPRLRWRWRAHALPVGADERVAERHDAAAQVYVVFDNQYWPRVIKYIWSSNQPVGNRFTNPLYGRGRVVVLRNGTSDKNKWYQEEANFLEDYRTLFGAEPGKVQGIGILTSSDATRSVATADYDDFMLLP
jgi:hypothetical protein